MSKVFPGLFIAFLIVTLFRPSASTAVMKPDDLRCEYAVNPLGVDIPNPRLFWVDRSRERGERQTAYQILVSSSLKELAGSRGDLWDSGKILSDETIGIHYAGVKLKSAEQAFWKVRVWDGEGNPSAWSNPAKWTMGLLHPADWQARWIAAPESCETVLIRHDFAVKPGLKRALVFVCGLGQYEMALNGKKVGDDFLSPGWTNYRRTCLYNTRDITAMLRNGTNAIGLFLANGMYNVEPGRYTKFVGTFGPLKAISEILLEYSNGTEEVVGTNESWRTAPGPITFSSIYGGEDFDARLLQPGWDMPGFDDSRWEAARIVKGPGGELKGLSCSAPPIREYQVHRPVSVRKLPGGDVVYDLGQNASHLLRITVTGPRGSCVKMFPSELVNPDGSISQSSIGANHDKPVFCEYIKRSDRPETYTTRFFYVGCRYVQVHFIPAEPGGRPPSLRSLEGIVVHSSSQPVGKFECSDTLFNRIYSLVRWAQESNMMSIMTDCPHRERLGWLEQDHLNGPSLRYNFDLAQLFTKEMNDMSDAQLPDGLVPDIAPEYTVFRNGFRDSPEWGSAYIIVPWQQYEFDGDLQLLREHFERMKRYIAYLGSKAKDDIVNYGLGDWCDLGPKAPGYAQLTPVALTATAFYYYDTHILARVAALLGKTDEAAKFTQKAEQIRDAFNVKFFNKVKDDYSTGSQTANAIPLVIGICPPDSRVAVLDSIVRDVREHGYGVTAGDVGYRYLLRALADHGRSDVIFKMTNRSDRPGYGYQLAKGATSLAESWDDQRNLSQDHFMLGQIVEWFYADLAGIRCDPAGPGFRKIVLRPQPVGDIEWVKASYRSIRGMIVSDWQKMNGKFSLHVVVPANTTATVYVPAKSAGGVTESGRPVAGSPDVNFLRFEGGYAEFELLSGEYIFRSKL